MQEYYKKGIGIVNYEYIHKWHLAENLNKIILHMIVRKDLWRLWQYV